MMFSTLFIFLVLELNSITSKHPGTYANSHHKHHHHDVISCLHAINAPLLTPTSPGWKSAIRPYNLRIAPIPKAIITPKDFSGIQDVMSCARLFPGTKLSPLCGGHSFASYGLGGTDGAVVVNMKNFKHIEMLLPQDSSHIVRVGGGVVIRELINFLLQNGELYFAHARGTEVGVVGSAIGGGFGTASRLVGTTMDHVVGASIILPNGTFTHVTAEKHSEIFFAVLGAGSSFGTIISLDLKVYKPYPNPVIYLYKWNKPTLEQAVRTFNVFQDYGLNTATPELSIRLGLGLPSNVTLEGVYYGHFQNYNKLIDQLLCQLPPPDVSNVTISTFAESEASISGSLQGPPVIPMPDITYTNSLLVFHPLDTETITGFLSDLITRSEEKLSEGFALEQFADLWGGDGAYSSKMTKEDSITYGFPHNQVFLLIRVDGILLDKTNATKWPTDGIDFVKTFTKRLFDSQENPRSYPNYRDTDYTLDEWSSRYYAHAYPKLQRIKAELNQA